MGEGEERMQGVSGGVAGNKGRGEAMEGGAGRGGGGGGRGEGVRRGKWGEGRVRGGEARWGRAWVGVEGAWGRGCGER